MLWDAGTSRQEGCWAYYHRYVFFARSYAFVKQLVLHYAVLWAVALVLYAILFPLLHLCHCIYVAYACLLFRVIFACMFCMGRMGGSGPGNRAHIARLFPTAFA